MSNFALTMISLTIVSAALAAANLAGLIAISWWFVWAPIGVPCVGLIALVIVLSILDAITNSGDFI